jgi:hypothetical protein
VRPGAFDLVIHCGTTVDAATHLFTYKVGGTPVDLSGFRARSQARYQVAGRESIVFDLTTENGGVLLNAAQGQFALLMSADVTASLWRTGLPAVREFSNRMLHDSGMWDFELVSADGRVTRLLQGRLLLSPEATR